MSANVNVQFSAQPAANADLLILQTNAQGDLGSVGQAYWQKTQLDLERLSAVAHFKGNKGQFLEVLTPPNLDHDKLWIMGLSDKKDDGKSTADGAAKIAELPKGRDWAKAGGALAGRILSSKAKTIAILCDEDVMSVEMIAELAGGVLLRNYKFEKYKSSQNKNDDAGEGAQAVTIEFVHPDPEAVASAFVTESAIVDGTLLARDLVHEPANALGPEQFVERVAELRADGLDVEILDKTQMQELGMNALLAVAQGSARPPYLAIMRWNGGEADTAPVAFVGKGVTFDSGGISIKPAGAMENMKGDMGGAAATVGAMKALAKRKAKVNAVGVIGLVENMPSGTAMRPSDIFTAMSGTTIEVVNTDAEGRMVLADALWYTQDRFKPACMINLATLTGAIMVALGQDYAGLFSNDDALAEALNAAGLQSGEKLWRMPIGPYYNKLIESRFADIKNTGGRFGGASTAAQFLERFTNGVPWAHLDIAATAFAAPASDVNRSWAPGFGVALLNQYVRDNFERQS